MIDLAVAAFVLDKMGLGDTWVEVNQSEDFFA
jgi:hypothetical protein